MNPPHRHATQARVPPNGQPHRVGVPLADRILGAVLGAAIGDAMGHPTEFVRSVSAIRQKFGPNGVEGFVLFWERDGQRFAPYTDDTQLAEIVLATALDAASEGEDLDAAMSRLSRGFVAWAKAPQGGHRSPGNSCLSGAGRLASGVRWDQGGAPDAGGCGSVMRAYPIGLVFRTDAAQREAWAVAQSRLTHNSPMALAACAAMAHGVASVLTGDAPAQTVTVMREAAARHDRKTANLIADAVARARAGEPPEEVLEELQGWAANDAIAAAVYVYMRHPDDFRAAVLEAANSPGDSDSIATLTGALLGARHGFSAIPAEWIRDVERSTALAALAQRAVEQVGR
jgi:ADP-ribosylglycohydrolase